MESSNAKYNDNDNDNDKDNHTPPPMGAPLPMRRDTSEMDGSYAIEMTKTLGEHKDSTSNIVKSQSHSLKRSILNKFVPLTFSLLLGVSLCTITFLYVSNRIILQEVHNILKDQYSRYGGHIAQGIIYSLPSHSNHILPSMMKSLQAVLFALPCSLFVKTRYSVMLCYDVL
jgi:hypothetical protein